MLFDGVCRTMVLKNSRDAKARSFDDCGVTGGGLGDSRNGNGG